MKKYAAFLVAFVLFPLVNAVCITPSENLEITESAVLCYGTYNIGNGIRIVSDNLILDCNNSALIGDGIGFGILLKNRHNDVVRNCNISNYEAGIYLESTNNSNISNNYLTKNKFGIAMFDSFGNDLRENFQAENINNEINYIPAPLTEGKKQAFEKEQAGTPNQILEEVIRIKKPFLGQEEVLNEVDSILGRYFNATKENLEITREVIYNEADKSTEIILHLKPKKVLLNVSIYEKIPKCVSAYVNEVFFEAAGYEVVEDDPLILWTFPRLESERDITYRVFRSIDDECRNLLLAFGIATGFGEFENIEKIEEKQFSYLVILIIAFVVLAAAIFLKTKMKKSS